jgi:hypothetical protein
MRTRAYTFLGWAAWQGVKLKLRQNRSKIGAVATVGLVLVAGLAAAKVSSSLGDDES